MKNDKRYAKKVKKAKQSRLVTKVANTLRNYPTAGQGHSVKSMTIEAWQARICRELKTNIALADAVRREFEVFVGKI